jgi:hypothetical protein
MSKNFCLAVCVSALAISATTFTQGGGVFFSEGWESGSIASTFNSRYYGNGSSATEFSVQNGVHATGLYALAHTLPTSGTPQYVTQHFGDARSGPVWASRAGEHFQNLYVQYKVYYSPGFEFEQYKQLIIGTEDDQRHDNVCCNPWVAHYLTVYTRGQGELLAEANNKQGPSNQWWGIPPNVNGYTTTNRFRFQPGRWYTIEVRRQLNDPGTDNGIFQMWADNQLVADWRNVRWRVPRVGDLGTNFTYGTNFVMISDYSPTAPSQSQRVFYDDIKMSDSYIGGGAGVPTAPRNLRIVP